MVIVGANGSLSELDKFDEPDVVKEAMEESSLRPARGGGVVDRCWASVQSRQSRSDDWTYSVRHGR